MRRRLDLLSDTIGRAIEHARLHADNGGADRIRHVLALLWAAQDELDLLIRPASGTESVGDRCS
jgi:hypothetical protein